MSASRRMIGEHPARTVTRQRKGAGAISAALVMVLLAACGGGSEGAGESDGGPGDTGSSEGTSAADASSGGEDEAGESRMQDTLAFASFIGTSSFDPIAVSNPTQNLFLYPVYDRLIHLAPDGTLIPGLAESWEYNEDATQLAFTLRDGLVFSDGEVLDAAAVKANIERARDTETSVVRGHLAVVAGIETPDEATVTLTLSEADTSLAAEFSDRAGMMVSPAAFGGDLATEPVGAGEYTLVSYVDNDRAVYEQRDDYWNASADQPGTPNLEIRIFVDPQARDNAIRTGEVDAGWADAKSVAAFEADGFEVHPGPSLGLGRILLGSPVFSDVRVRKAVSLAIDREALSQVTFGGIAEPLVQPWPSSYFAAAPDVSIDLDVEEATRLLAEAGQDDLTFTTCIPSSEPTPAMGAAVQGMLAEAGVTMELRQLEVTQVADVYFNQQECDALMGFAPGAADPLILVSQFELPTGFYNREGIASQPIVDLYDKAKSETDEAARTELLQQLSAALAEEQVNIPLISLVRPDAVSSRVEGWNHYVSDVPEFRGITVIAE